MIVFLPVSGALALIVPGTVASAIPKISESCVSFDVPFPPATQPRDSRWIRPRPIGKEEDVGSPSGHARLRAFLFLPYRECAIARRHSAQCCAMTKTPLRAAKFATTKTGTQPDNGIISPSSRAVFAALHHR
jgi:hypothetical protein